MTPAEVRPAPAGLRLQPAGVVLLGLLLLAGCGGDEENAARDELGPRVLQLESTTVDLPDTVRQLVIRLDRSTRADMDRTTATLRVGDIARFEAADAGGHAIVFEGEALAPEARAWLEATGQLRSPPLIAAGNAWVLTFDAAPPGEYPFVCVTHGARGTLTVQPRR